MADFLVKIVELFSHINPLIPYYHVVSDEKLPHIIHLHPYKGLKLFLQDIDFFARHFNMIGLDDLLGHVYKGRELKKNSFILTFDDGYVECYSVIAPVLIRKGIPAIFFVCSDFVNNKGLSYRNKASLLIDRLLEYKGRMITEPVIPEHFSLDDKINFIKNISYKERFKLDDLAAMNGIDWGEFLQLKKPFLTIEQIKALQRSGFYIGAHGRDHAKFEELQIEEQLRQVNESILFLKNNLNLEYSLFAFPFHDQDLGLDLIRHLEPIVDICFGTGGIQSTTFKWNFPRINFERSLRPADQIYFRKLIKKMIYRYSP